MLSFNIMVLVWSLNVKGLYILSFHYRIQSGISFLLSYSRCECFWPLLTPNKVEEDCKKEREENATSKMYLQY